MVSYVDPLLFDDETSGDQDHLPPSLPFKREQTPPSRLLRHHISVTRLRHPRYVALKRAYAAHLVEKTKGGAAVDLDAVALPLWVRVAAGASANVLCWTVIYPVDVVKSVQQSQQAARRSVGRGSRSAATAAAAAPGAAAAESPSMPSTRLGAGGGVAPAAGRGGMVACARALVAEGGVARLYRGFGFTLLRAGPVAGMVLPLFDLSLAGLEKLVTSS